MRFPLSVAASLVALFVALAALAALAGLVYLIDWPSSPGDQWLAVTGLATSVIAVASLMGLAALGFLAQQTISSRRQARTQLGPYLRVDFAPDSDAGTWTPPQVEPEYEFDWVAFNPGESEPSTPLAAWHSVEGFDLCIWLENRQLSPGGTAYNIEIVTEISCTAVANGSDVDQIESFPFVLRVHYLEPGRRIRYRICHTRPRHPVLTRRCSCDLLL